MMVKTETECKTEGACVNAGFQEDTVSNFEKLKLTRVTGQITGTVLLLECLHTSAQHRQHSSLSRPTFNDPTHTHSHTYTCLSGQSDFTRSHYNPAFTAWSWRRAETHPPIKGRPWGGNQIRRDATPTPAGQTNCSQSFKKEWMAGWHWGSISLLWFPQCTARSLDLSLTFLAAYMCSTRGQTSM